MSETESYKVELLGYPMVETLSIDTLILPGMKSLNLTSQNVEDAFKGSKDLVVSPGNIIKKIDDENLIALSNPAAPRSSGSPLFLEIQ